MADKVTTTLFGVLAILPQPAERPAVETLEWLTDVSVSRNGTESRLQLRSAPRTQFEYTVPRSLAKRARGFNVEYGALRQRWAVPVWSQIQFVGSVDTAATSIACDVDVYEYRNSSLALLWQDDSTFAVVEINTVGADVLNLLAAVGTTFTAAYIMPLRVGFIAGSVDHTRTGSGDVAALRFDVDDNKALVPSAPSQFLGEDIYYDELLKGGNTYTARLTAEYEEADYALGARDRTAPWTYTRHLQTVQRVFETVADAYAFKLWLHRRAGKYRAFWTPTFESDLRVANTGTITTQLRWYKDGYLDWADTRVHIAIEDDAGNWYARTLSGVAVLNATTLQGTMDSALNLPATRIRRVSYLGLKRLASDAAELQWVGDGVSACTFGILEISP